MCIRKLQKFSVLKELIHKANTDKAKTTFNSLCKSHILLDLYFLKLIYKYIITLNKASKSAQTKTNDLNAKTE
ncbi:hypothetical protein BpHYR1_011180 [Brachionus plicatilis]|uniref:Uncharacterized protein n=1 Tax=Brachionus plicatilis TaxID=10195 RepID=A0A3M7PN69_BRAPC|nr:hypothetical protein BpHYR1_011180 [Brachionus plicatilis]